MGIINKMANKLGLRKRKYYTLMVKREDYITVKLLAADQKMTHVDLLHKLLTVYLEYKKKNYETIIAELEKKQDVLVDALKLYYERVGKIYESPAAATPKWSPNSDAR